MEIQLSRCTVAYEQAGKGIPILFIHGYPMNRRLWRPQMTGLAHAAQVWAIDLPGHGESEQIPGPYSMEAMADVCKEFLDALKIKSKVTLCGLSMGGYICMAFLRKYANRVAGTVFTSTRAAADSPEARNNRDNAISQVNSQGSATIVDGMINRLLSPYSLVNRPDILSETRQMMAGISTQTIIADLQGLKERADSRSLLAEIAQPVCIIHGEDDQVVPLAEAREMQQGIRNAHLHIIPKAGHIPNLEQPELFNQVVCQFIKEIEE